MASIYKLVAERRDRNQSMKRKRKDRNINLFKDSIDEVQVQYRQPPLYRNITLRQRTVSDQPPDVQFALRSSIGNRRPTSDTGMINIKNQLKEVDTKVEVLIKKIDEMSTNIVKLKMALNKK